MKTKVEWWRKLEDLAEDKYRLQGELIEAEETIRDLRRELREARGQASKLRDELEGWETKSSHGCIGAYCPLCEGYGEDPREARDR